GNVVDDQTIVINEYDLDATQACFTQPGSYFAAPSSGGLGWGLGAALGAKLAAPDKTVVCCVGDGAYIFGAPTAAHFVSRAYSLRPFSLIHTPPTGAAGAGAGQRPGGGGGPVKPDPCPPPPPDPPRD